MEIGDEVNCSECDEVITIDETDMDEGEILCPICGNFEQFQIKNC